MEKEKFVSLGDATESIVWDLLRDIPHACIIAEGTDWNANGEKWYEVGVSNCLPEVEIEKAKVQFEHWGEETE